MSTPPEHNPNRDLAPEQVESLFAKNLPHLVSGLGRDRQWIWFSSDKPSEEERKTLKGLGFSFTPRPHALPDGRQAFWFHPCGGVVLRRKHGKAGGSRQQSSASRSDSSSADAGAEFSSEAFADLERLANILP